MKNNYYTPEIKEFHVGFEYESASIDNNWTIRGWGDVIFSEKTSIEGIKNYPNFQRVKYLDNKDIESFGFKLRGFKYKKDIKETTVLLYDKDNFTLGHHIDSNEITIFITDPTENGEFPQFIADYVQVNKIIVKNKSELKKLLTQLNIL